MKFTWTRFKKSIGPGVITGVADDDPSGIATYGQTGVLFGLTQLWLTLYSLPFMIAVQEMCARIGMATGKGVAGVIKSHYSKYVLFFSITLLGIANIINIGADLGAMGQATHMILPISPGIALIGVTIFSLLTIILIPYHTYAKILKYLALTVFAYVISAFFITYDWGDIFAALLVPHIIWEKSFLLNMMAFLGTTISPYLFFWQADEEVEEQIDKKTILGFGKGRPKLTSHDIAQMKVDTVVGMTLSNTIAFFIIISASATLGGQTEGEIATAAQLAEALRPLAGDFAVYLFAYGILGTGLLAIPVLAGSFAYAIGETFSMNLGLSKTFMQATGFYSVFAIAMLVGVILNFINLDPIHMLYYSAVANGLLASPLLLILLIIANNKRIMGDYKNSKLSNLLVGTITIIMGITALFTIEFLLKL
jgi:Mn2+/Fe2+ NRAMP family transporter